MNKFIFAYQTDVGIKKQTNEDSILINGIAAGEDEILMAVICDGMGGMEKGELASATVVNAFDDWFQNRYIHIEDKWNIQLIKEQWTDLIVEYNNKLIKYGKKQGIQLGTTVTVLLVGSNGKYVIAHIGDTRIYYLTNKIQQLTEDHTLIAREIKNGNMTKEQAVQDSRRNVLLQCVGVNRTFEIQFLDGETSKGGAFLLCSDGFRHQISEEEIFAQLHPDKMVSNEQTEQQLLKMVELNKERQEKDNISVIYIKNCSM